MSKIRDAFKLREPKRRLRINVDGDSVSTVKCSGEPYDNPEYWHSCLVLGHQDQRGPLPRVMPVHAANWVHEPFILVDKIAAFWLE